MKTLFLIILFGVLMNGEKEIFNFKSTDSSGEWRIINDDVMGGISQSSFKINTSGTATFSGKLSPENNGGFASARALLEEFEKNDFDGVIILVKGDGKIYSLRFRTNLNFDGISYQTKFDTEEDKWEEFRIPFTEFSPTFRGSTLKDRPPLESKNIKQVGILIADKQYGDFSLQLGWIKFYNNDRKN